MKGITAECEKNTNKSHGVWHRCLGCSKPDRTKIDIFRMIIICFQRRIIWMIRRTKSNGKILPTYWEFTVPSTISKLARFSTFRKTLQKYTISHFFIFHNFERRSPLVEQVSMREGSGVRNVIAWRWKVKMPWRSFRSRTVLCAILYPIFHFFFASSSRFYSSDSRQRLAHFSWDFADIILGRARLGWLDFREIKLQCILWRLNSFSSNSSMNETRGKTGKASLKLPVGKMWYFQER